MLLICLLFYVALFVILVSVLCLVDRVYGLSTLDCHFSFLQCLFRLSKIVHMIPQLEAHRRLFHAAGYELLIYLSMPCGFAGDISTFSNLILLNVLTTKQFKEIHFNNSITTGSYIKLSIAVEESWVVDP